MKTKITWKPKSDKEQEEQFEKWLQYYDFECDYPTDGDIKAAFKAGFKAAMDLILGDISEFFKKNLEG